VSWFSPAQRVCWWLLLLALLAVTALIATDKAASFTERTCPWDAECATPASIEEDGNE
jgi:hypothetical protein